VLGESHLRYLLKSYFHYYHHSGTHLALGKEATELRSLLPKVVRFSVRRVVLKTASSGIPIATCLFDRIKKRDTFSEFPRLGSGQIHLKGYSWKKSLLHNQRATATPL
jgi:hypothetical protein